MIKQSLKNYFKCLKYVFTPLGVIALGFVLGLSIVVPVAIDSVKQTLSTVLSASGEAVDFEALFHHLVSSIQAMDWTDVNASLTTLFTKEWWIETFETEITTIVGDIQGLLETIKTAVEACISDLVGCVVVVVFFVIIAFIASYFLTKWIIRHDIARRKIWKFVISSVFGSLLSTALAVVSVYLGVLWTESLYISVVVSFIIASLFSLISAYLIHGYKKIPAKDIVNAKNIAMLLLSNLIIFAISVVIVLLVTVITNVAVGIFVALGVLIVTLAVLEMNAEAYVKATAASYGINIGDDAPASPAVKTENTEKTEKPDKSKSAKTETAENTEKTEKAESAEKKAQAEAPQADKAKKEKPTANS